MKTIISAILLLMAIPSAWAADYSFVKTGGGHNTVLGTIANEDGLAYDRKFYLNPATYDGRRLSAVVAYSSVTFSDVTFSTNAYTVGDSVISATAHGLQTAVPVLLTATAGTAPIPLIDQTTYYAYRTSANTVEIASTQANAIAGVGIDINTNTASGTFLMTLSALAYSGTPSFKWEGSNDSQYWFTLNTASVTMSSPNFAITAWDFEEYNFASIRLNALAPSTGAILLKAYGEIKE